MHFFYNDNNDVLIGTIFKQETENFKKIQNDVFVSSCEINIFNPKQFNIVLKPGFNKLNMQEIELIQQITKMKFNYDYSSGIKVGYVQTCVEHPNSDHMHVLSVNVGDEILDIVCGASNIKQGQYVAVATPNAYLPNLNLFIKPSKLRGVASNGMICSKYELGLTQEKGKGIWEISQTTQLGMDVFQIK